MNINLAKKYSTAAKESNNLPLLGYSMSSTSTGRSTKPSRDCEDLKPSIHNLEPILSLKV